MEENRNIEERPEDGSPEEIHENEPVNIQSSMSNEELQTVNSKLETENMEVHHHPQVEKKNFKEYFLEFLMIFLAVTMGFFAESYREYLSDQSKEKEYIKSMIEDLETDSAFLELSVYKLIPYHLTWLDSTMHLLSMPDLKGKDRQIYQAFMLGTAWAYNFHPTERTLSQLHSDGYHLIKNKNAANSISQLEEQYKQFNSQIEPFVQNMQNDLDLSAYLFADRVITDSISRTAMQNFSVAYSVQLKLQDVPESATINTADKEGIRLYNDKLKKYSFYLQYGIKGGHVIILRQIKSTIAVLKKEYDLENE
jgi:hypothetical protein